MTCPHCKGMMETQYDRAVCRACGRSIWNFTATDSLAVRRHVAEKERRPTHGGRLMDIRGKEIQAEIDAQWPTIAGMRGVGKSLSVIKRTLGLTGSINSLWRHVRAREVAV